jgi:hypothetical protein
MGIIFPDLIKYKQSFSDLGALTQLATSRPVYYPAYVVSNTNNVSYSSPGSDLMVPYPVYNYYPQTPLNPTPTNTLSGGKLNNNNNKAFVNQPGNGYNSHLLSYYGGYPYPLPMVIYPSTNIDNVKGVEDKI